MSRKTTFKYLDGKTIIIDAKHMCISDGSSQCFRIVYDNGVTEEIPYCNVRYKVEEITKDGKL